MAYAKYYRCSALICSTSICHIFRENMNQFFTYFNKKLQKISKGMNYLVISSIQCERSLPYRLPLSWASRAAVAPSPSFRGSSSSSPYPRSSSYGSHAHSESPMTRCSDVYSGFSEAAEGC